jgi:hypothetical protein
MDQANFHMVVLFATVHSTVYGHQIRATTSPLVRHQRKAKERGEALEVE